MKKGSCATSGSGDYAEGGGKIGKGDQGSVQACERKPDVGFSHGQGFGYWVTRQMDSHLSRMKRAMAKTTSTVVERMSSQFRKPPQTATGSNGNFWEVSKPLLVREQRGGSVMLQKEPDRNRSQHLAPDVNSTRSITLTRAAAKGLFEKLKS